MRALARIWNYLIVLGKARRNRSDLPRWMVRRPQLLVATGIYETALLLSNRLDPKLKELAELKVASLVTCEFCLDIGSALARGSGVGEDQLRDLARYRESDAYSELEKLVIGYAEAVTATPAPNPEELRSALLTHLSRGQVAELAATIAWENQRARLNQALGVRSAGMSDGQVCALPQRPAH